MDQGITTPHLDNAWLAAYAGAWSSGDATELCRYFTENGVYVEGGMGQTYVGVDQVARFFRFMLTFSRDSLVEFTGVIQDGRDLCLPWTWWGTADGPLKVDGVVHAGNGAAYSVDGVAICRLAEDGRVELHHDFYDVRTLMRQVGALT